MAVPVAEPIRSEGLDACGGAGASVDDSYLPKSTSSAMPDLAADTVPRLKARIHQRLSHEECAKIPLSALRFRPLHREDLSELVALHTEWFPVSYDDAFYQSAVRGDIFSMVATYSRSSSSRSSSSQAGLAPRFDGSVGAGSSAAEDDEELLGMLTMSRNCEHHCSDIESVLGADCATCCRRGSSSSTCAGLENTDELVSDHETAALAYILTLGVVDQFRRRGLGRELLRQMIKHVDETMPFVQAIYLHVVTYNDAAVSLYESSNFRRIAQFTSFYFLHGKYYDSFLYALYLHHGRPPWRWRLRQFLGIGVDITWKEWLLSAVTSFWRSQSTEQLHDVKQADIEAP